MSDGSKLCPSCSKQLDANVDACPFCQSIPGVEQQHDSFTLIQPLEYQFGLSSLGLGELEPTPPSSSTSYAPPTPSQPINPPERVLPVPPPQSLVTKPEPAEVAREVQENPSLLGEDTKYVAEVLPSEESEELFEPSSGGSKFCLTCTRDYDSTYKECPNCKRISKQHSYSLNRARAPQENTFDDRTPKLFDDDADNESDEVKVLVQSPPEAKIGSDDISEYKDFYRRTGGNISIDGSTQIEPLLAALLSGCCFAGIGQVVNGQLAKGVFLMFTCAALAMATGGATSIPVNILLAIDAFRIGGKKKQGKEIEQWEWF